MSTDATPPAGTLPVTIRSICPATPAGVIVLARIDAPSVGVDCSYLFLDPANNTLGLKAPCGCALTLELSKLVLDLAAVIVTGHDVPAPHASGLH